MNRERSNGNRRAERGKTQRGRADEFYPDEAYDDDFDANAFDDASYDDGDDFDADEDLDEDDLFDDVSLGEDADAGFGSEDADAIIGDSRMEDKIFNQAMNDRRGDGQNDRRAEDYGEADQCAGARGSGSGNTVRGRKNPRELNTAGSTIDRSQVSREKEQKKKGKLKKIIGWVLVEALTLCLIFGYGFVLRSWNMFTRPGVNEKVVENNNISMEKKKEMEGYWTIAAFGLDARDTEDLQRWNSDVIMLISINMDTGDIKLCSVFRDTYLNISSKNQYNKINAAYANGGPEQALAALNKNLDLNIKNYVTVNWKSVAEAINILGGVDDVDISKAELYYINAYITDTVKGTGIGSHQLKKTGPQHLDGVQAVAYARLRYMDNDFARTERQRIILKKCFEKAKQADFSVLNNILVTCAPNMLTNISMNQVVRMAQGITKYNIAGTGGFPWSRGDALISGKGACVIPTTLESNVVKLHEFLFEDTNYQPSKAVLQYSSKIKEDSRLYKEGVPIESVATDQGVIQKPKATTRDENTDDEDDEESSSREKYTIGTDENGNLIYPTDEDGELVIPTNADGDVIYPTDADGNRIRPSRETRPTETRPTELAEPTEGDAGSEIVDDNGNVISPGETSNHPGGNSQTGGTVRPTETLSPAEEQAGTKPQTGNSGTRPTEPQQTTQSGSNIAPTAPTPVPDEPVIVPSTTAAAPGGNSGAAVPGGPADAGPGGVAGPGL